MKRKVVIIILSILVFYLIYLAADLFKPLPIGKKSIEIEIPKGTTFRQAVEILSKERLIRNKTLFIFLGRISGLDRKVKAGFYSICWPVRTLDIFKMLKKGQIIEYEITIVEGDSMREIGEKLSGRGILSKEEFKKLSTDEDFLFFHDIDATTFEGYLFPDTYRISKGMDPEDVISMMINRMREQYSGELLEKTYKIGLSEREVLTLASIIEKEAETDRERPIISAVYHNRLKKGIPLQADPTSVYGVKSFREKITGKDLRRKTPYNTYIIKGLPPGPICSPGIKSITAALYPAKVPYLYFVSNMDGTHTFSVTLSEHLAAVRAQREKREKEEKEKSEEYTGTNEDS